MNLLTQNPSQKLVEVEGWWTMSPQRKGDTTYFFRMDSAPPILTEINSSYLECTVHSSKYHCLVKLRSHRSAAVKTDVGVSPSQTVTTTTHHQCKESMAIPDLSSLSATPIRTVNAQNLRSSVDNEDAVSLLPKLVVANHSNAAVEEFTSNAASVGNGSNNKSTIRGDNYCHPSYELMRITRDMENQLIERLKDASDGAVMARTNNDGNAGDAGGLRHNSTLAEIHEEFLLRCEAIMLELTSSVQQQLRREEKVRHQSGNKRKGTGGRQAVSATISNNMSSLSSITPPFEYYAALIHQLQMLSSMSNVTDVSLHKQPTSTDNNNSTRRPGDTPADLTSVSITCLDSKKRTHTWRAELYPSIVLTMDLPSEFIIDDKHLRLERWWEDVGATSTTSRGEASTSDSVLSGVLPRVQNHFENALQTYQALFDELDDLDSHLWILEPSLPARRSSIERRIALWEGGASIVIVLDPYNARGIPVMVRFLGVTVAAMKAANAQASIASNNDSGVVNLKRASDFVDWRTSFSEFVSLGDDQNRKLETDFTTKHYWSEKRSIRENLELWFGSPLPSPLFPSTEISDFLVECGICYTHRLPAKDSNGDTDGGPLPEAKCSNSSCNRHYHESCLFEWLHSLPTARVSFDRVFGSCMYCCEPVSVKILNGASNY